MKVIGQNYAMDALNPVKDPGTHWTGDCMGPSAGLDVSEKPLAPAGIQTPDPSLAAYSI